MTEKIEPKKTSSPHLVVGAAVTLNDDGLILIAQRRSTDSLGGFWEFPGGKKEANENLPDCVKRELFEELGIEVEVGKLLTIVEHQYADFSIELHTYFTKIIRGNPQR